MTKLVPVLCAIAIILAYAASESTTDEVVGIPDLADALVPEDGFIQADQSAKTPLGDMSSFLQKAPFIAHKLKLTEKQKPFNEAMLANMKSEPARKKAMESISGRKAFGAMMNTYLLHLRTGDGGHDGWQWLVKTSKLSDKKLVKALKQWESLIQYPELVKIGHMSQKEVDTSLEPKDALHALRVALAAATQFPPAQTSRGILGSTDLHVLFEMENEEQTKKEETLELIAEETKPLPTPKTPDQALVVQEEEEEEEVYGGKGGDSYSGPNRHPSYGNRRRPVSQHDTYAAKATAEHAAARAETQKTRRMAAGRMAARCMQAYLSLVPGSADYCRNPSCGFWSWWSCDSNCGKYGSTPGVYNACWPYCGIGDAGSCFARHATNFMEIVLSGISIAAIVFSGGAATPAVAAARTACSSSLRSIGRSSLRSFMRKAARKLKDLGSRTWDQMTKRLLDDVTSQGGVRGVLINGLKGNIRETAFKNTCTAIGKAMLTSDENGNPDDFLPSLVPGVSEYKALAKDCGDDYDTNLCVKATLNAVALVDPTGLSAVAASIIEKDCKVHSDHLPADSSQPEGEALELSAFNRCSVPHGRSEIDFTACEVTPPGQTCRVHCKTDGNRKATYTCPSGGGTLTGTPPSCPCAPNNDYKAIMSEGIGHGCLSSDARMPNKGCVVKSSFPWATSSQGCYYCRTSGGTLETIKAYKSGAEVTGHEPLRHFHSRHDQQISTQQKNDCDNTAAIQAEAARERNEKAWARSAGERASYMDNPHSNQRRRRRRTYGGRYGGGGGGKFSQLSFDSLIEEEDSP
jgi:hypothetical protein